MKQRISTLLNEMRTQIPLVHNITNYVTVNDCANALLAIGASPIMADDILEAADITAISKALVINIGTLNQRTVDSMVAAGIRANELGIPVVFDPVGAGASNFRNKTVVRLLREVKMTIIRGNLSEVSYIAGLAVNTKGVDSSDVDADIDAASVVKKVAKQYQCVAAITGVVDYVSDGETLVQLKNGHAMLAKVTGTGCMTSSITGGFAATASMSSNPDYLAACVGGILSMSLAGELAYEKAGQLGTGSFHIAIIDALSQLNETQIKEMADIE